MKIRFKKLNENAVMPTKAHASDAGFDLTATSRMYDNNNCYVYGCGLAVEIPEGYVGLVFPRSSIANKDLLLSNSVASENPTPTPAPDNNEGPSSPDNTDNDNNPPSPDDTPKSELDVYKGLTSLERGVIKKVYKILDGQKDLAPSIREKLKNKMVKQLKKK